MFVTFRRFFLRFSGWGWSDVTSDVIPSPPPAAEQLNNLLAVVILWHNRLAKRLLQRFLTDCESGPDGFKTHTCTHTQRHTHAKTHTLQLPRPLENTDLIGLNEWKVSSWSRNTLNEVCIEVKHRKYTADLKMKLWQWASLVTECEQNLMQTPDTPVWLNIWSADALWEQLDLQI